MAMVVLWASACSLLYKETAAGASADAAPSCPGHEVESCPIPFLKGDCGCYQFPEQDKGEWAAGAVECLTLGSAFPVIVETQAENLWISDFVQERFWLGLGAPQGENRWVWAGGEPLGEFSGFPGGPPATSDSDTLCASSKDGVWQITICEDSLRVLCEYVPIEEE
jgi:hypothetical protein